MEFATINQRDPTRHHHLFWAVVGSVDTVVLAQRVALEEKLVVGVVVIVVTVAQVVEVEAGVPRGRPVPAVVAVVVVPRGTIVSA